MYLGDDEDRRRFLVSGVADTGLTGKWFENEGAPVLREIPNRELSKYAFRAERHLRGYEFKYGSPLDFVIHQLTFRPQLQILADRAERSAFNRRTLTRVHRIKLLRYLVEKRIDNPEHTSGAIGIVTDIYSNRWATHPEGDRMQNYFELALDSLVESGDLTKKGIYYQAAPKALSTLASLEEEERRHVEQITQQRWLKTLTAALVLVGVVQVLIQFLSWLNAD